MATSTFGLGRKHWSSPQQCYLSALSLYFTLMTTELTTILQASLYASTSWADLNNLKYISPVSTSTDILQRSHCSESSVHFWQLLKEAATVMVAIDCIADAAQIARWCQCASYPLGLHKSAIKRHLNRSIQFCRDQGWVMDAWQTTPLCSNRLHECKACNKAYCGGQEERDYLSLALPNQVSKH